MDFLHRIFLETSLNRQAVPCVEASICTVDLSLFKLITLPESKMGPQSGVVFLHRKKREKSFSQKPIGQTSFNLCGSILR